MTESLTIPHFGLSDEITMDSSSSFRSRLNARLAKAPSKDGVQRISYMPIMVKALSMALKSYPILNSCVVEGADGSPALAYRSAHNIGIAMDCPNGLIVPNVKNVQDKSILDIAAELQRLQEAGSIGKLAPADLQGGTITLSNIGTIGGTYTSPVLVKSEVCIGAVGQIQRVPRFALDVHGVEQVIPRQILTVSWSADHRVIDGATMAKFNALWKGYLEQPELMASELS